MIEKGYLLIDNGSSSEIRNYRLQRCFSVKNTECEKCGVLLYYCHIRGRGGRGRDIGINIKNAIKSCDVGDTHFAFSGVLDLIGRKIQIILSLKIICLSHRSLARDPKRI